VANGEQKIALSFFHQSVTRESFANLRQAEICGFGIGTEKCGKTIAGKTILI